MVANGDRQQTIQEKCEMSTVTRHLERRPRGHVDSPTKTILIALAAVVTLTGCDFIPFSGGKLEGKLAQAPADWAAIARPDVIRLETQPSDPYSVKLWIVGKGPLLYVHAGANRAAWVEHIEADANVRLLIDGNLYELVAERVTDPGEFDAFGDLYEAKYGHRPRNEDVDQAYLFRLGARPG
jgi:hypothetical protein